MNVMEWIRPSRTVEAHCDLPCGIYDPEQARIEAESVYNIIKKYNDSKDDVYRQRAIVIKEERAELAKHHLDVLWSDWYKPEKHDAKFPELKDALGYVAGAACGARPHSPERAARPAGSLSPTGTRRAANRRRGSSRASRPSPGRSRAGSARWRPAG